MTAQPLFGYDTGTVTTEHAANTLRRSFHGQVHTPGDPTYDDARRPRFGAADPHPAIVAEASTPADVRSAVCTAREYDLPFAVQSTGHGALVSADDALLLKTSRMAQVMVDPDRRIARVGPGARWSEVIAAAEPFGLAPLSGDTPTVGVVGYTLGGGQSWLSRKYGFAADSLLRVDLVTADGRLVTASRRKHPDLFWALRGGSGNFGVVTAMEFRLYPVDVLYGGVAVFPIERAADVLDYVAEHKDEQPDELTHAMVVTKRSPIEGVEGPVLAVRGAYAGDPADAMKALRPVWDVAGTPLASTFRPMTYSDTATIGGTPPRQYDMFDALPSSLIDQIMRDVSDEDSGVNAVEIRHWGGAIAHPTHEAPGPISHRDVPFNMKIDAAPGAADAIAAYATGGSFLNFLHDTTQTHTAYTPQNYQRLGELKWAYDPDNFFHRQHNIPAAS